MQKTYSVVAKMGGSSIKVGAGAGRRLIITRFKYQFSADLNVATRDIYVWMQKRLPDGTLYPFQLCTVKSCTAGQELILQYGPEQFWMHSPAADVQTGLGNMTANHSAYVGGNGILLEDEEYLEFYLQNAVAGDQADFYCFGEESPL